MVLWCQPYLTADRWTWSWEIHMVGDETDVVDLAGGFVSSDAARESAERYVYKMRFPRDHDLYIPPPIV